MDHISVVIIHYNTPEDTLECLASLAQVRTKNFQFSVTIVDNASREPFEIPRALAKANWEVVRSESNLGFTGGNNLGIKHALESSNSDYILLLNSDTYVDPNFLIQLYDHAQNFPQDGMINPKIYFAKGYEFHEASYKPTEKGNVIWFGGGSIDWPNLLAFHRAVDELDRGQVQTIRHTDFATGCCVLIKREVIEKIGLLDERFFLYLEDVDWSVRAQQAGYQIGFCPEALVWHKNAGSSGGSGSSLQQYYMTRNRLLFGLKHGSNRVKLTTVLYGLRLLRSPHKSEQLAVLDLIQGKLGKRIVI